VSCPARSEAGRERASRVGEMPAALPGGAGIWRGKLKSYDWRACGRPSASKEEESFGPDQVGAAVIVVPQSITGLDLARGDVATAHASPTPAND